MKSAFVALLLLSSVLCQYRDEDYADVRCQFHWGGMVCDCENMKYLMRLPPLDGSVRNIHVKNCEYFLMPADSLFDLGQLVSVKFENISELVLHEYSLNSTRYRPAIRLEILNSNVPNIPSHVIKGGLEELIINRSNVSKIHSFAFTGFFNEITAIRIINSTINEIEAQAFKKLTTLNLELVNSKFLQNSVSRTFYDCHVESFTIENCYFSTLNPSTFDLRDVQRLTIQNSTFGLIGGEAFIMQVADRAIFSNNTVSVLDHQAFRGITMSPKTPTVRTKEVYFEFNGNHIDFIDPESDIHFCPEMKLQVSKLFLRDHRDCESVSRIYENKFFNDNSNSIFMRLEDGDFESISYLNDHCREESNWFWILMIVIGVIVLVLILLIALFCFCRNKRKLDIIMPEPRTYRQTQIVMQVETHGLIKTDF